MTAMPVCSVVTKSQALVHNQVGSGRCTTLATESASPRGFSFSSQEGSLGVSLDVGMSRYVSKRNLPHEEEGVLKLCYEGHLTEAVEALEDLVHSNRCVSKSVLYTVLRKCVGKKDRVLGSRVIACTVKKGYRADTFLCNHILRICASRGKLRDAMDVFKAVGKPDAFTWSAIISAHVKHGQDKQAIQLYQQMRRSGVKPDGHVFVAALQACAKAADLKTGQEVHADVLASGRERDLFVSSCLVDMYAKCRSLADAQGVFNRLSHKNVVTWTAMIAGYSQQGMGLEALSLYSAMQEAGMAAPDSVTFVCLLQACASVGTPALDKGKHLHAQARERGYEADRFVASSLLHMYVKCGSLKDAQRVFDGLSRKDLVVWTAMITGYSHQGMGQEALSLYTAMQEEGTTVPDSVTFMCLLQACASVGTSALEMGRQLHAQMRERGHDTDVFVSSSLLNMYAKCGSLEDAQRLFDGLAQKNVVTWNAMIAGYSQQGMGQEALRLYPAMQEAFTAPDAVTFECLLQACAKVGTPALETGKHLHAELRERGLETHAFVASSLLTMYAKCGSLEDAQRVFNALGIKDVVAWTAMIAGYSQQGMGQEALRVYRAMQEEGMVVHDSVTFTCLLQACGNVAALSLGRQLHSQILKQGLEAHVVIAGSLINMYGKCGSMVDAQRVFDALSERNVVVWSALIAGYACQGKSDMVFGLLQRMEEEGIRPNSITLLSVLTVCSHEGLVKKGWEYFEAMSTHYGITPTEDHYTCMVDLLGRAGQLDEALALVTSMPMLPRAAVWHTLLGACQKWGNLEVGRYVFSQVGEREEEDAAAYVLMSNIYSGAQMWEQAEEMQVSRQRMKAWKQPGQSWWIDKDGLLHSFLVGDEK